MEDKNEDDGFMATNIRIKILSFKISTQYIESMLKNVEHQVITILMDLRRTVIIFLRSEDCKLKVRYNKWRVVPWTSDP